MDFYQGAVSQPWSTDDKLKSLGLMHSQCIRTNLCLNLAYNRLTHKSGIQQYFQKVCSKIGTKVNVQCLSFC